MSDENARPQDLGRPHRRSRPGLAPETAELLERYRGAMRAELGMLLEMLGARRVGLMPDAPGELVIPLAERAKLWELTIKLGRELGAPGLDEHDPEPPASPSTTSSPRSGRAPRLSARERRSLGG